MSYNFSRVLALAPHTDDAELGAGGTLARWTEENKEIFYAAFSIAEKSVPEGLPGNILEQEVKQAIHTLGIPCVNLNIYKFELRKFPSFRQDILDILIDLRGRLNPDLVLLPTLGDVHQDHHVIAEEGVRAFKNMTILGYELPWNLLSFAPSLYLSLEKKHLSKKVQALGCYQSQRHRKYTNEDFIYGWAKMRGTSINCEYAEAFEVIRWVMR